MHVVAALDQMETGIDLEAVAHSPDVCHWLRPVVELPKNRTSLDFLALSRLENTR